jgi:hypothetical protein
MKFIWMIHTSSAIMGPLFHEASTIFSTLLPVFSKMLYTKVAKFPASTLKHLTKTMFQFAVICKMASIKCILHRAKQVVLKECHIWAVSGMGKNSPTHFCNCLSCAQAGMRPGSQDGGEHLSRSG